MTVALFLALSLLVSASGCEQSIETGAEETPVVILDPGHGGEDSGAIGVNGAYEKDINLQISLMMEEELCRRGYTVVQTRREDRLLYTDAENVKGIRKISDLKNRVKVFNSYNGAVVVSIHMNSFAKPQYSGLQVYYAETEGSDALANAIKNSVINTLQPDNRRAIKNGSDIYVLKHATTVAVLVECGFLSNPEECQKLSEKEYQKALSFSVVCGIIDYIEQN